MPGPLEGVGVLSFGRALAGPFASMLLADLGAEVIKVEDPNGGDFTRYAGPFTNDISSYFLSVNRGKKSITLNLRNERGKKLVYGLVKGVDIVLENFRPGVMARLGLSYDVLREINPKILFASISGFGQSGPYSQKPAYDMIAQGMGGVVSMTGEPDGMPARVGYSIGDMGASLFSTVAILAALYERERSGVGQMIDVSMLDSQVALGENAISRYLADSRLPKPLGSRHPLFTPFQVFPTKDGYVILIAFGDPDWSRFCRAVGKEEWITDEAFKSNAARLKNYKRFLEEMNELMRMRSTNEWLELLDAHEVMCGPVNTIQDVVNDPHVLEREMIREVEHTQGGTFKVVGTPMKFSRTPCSIGKASPVLGEHTDEILTQRQHLSQEEIQSLRDAKII
ncbi:MAG: CoA transferase [Proteobacteria bacterium]|nr:CoA transferase [Pseudomonadota bacterium]